MAIEIIEDLVSPEVGGRVDENGLIQPRKFYIGGLTPGPGIWSQARAAVAAAPYNVAYMQPHPFETGIVCRIIEPKPFLKSPSAVTIMATYQSPQFFGVSEQIIRFRATTKSILTNFDNTGKKITIDYTPSGGSALSPPPLGQLEESYAYGILEFEQTTYSAPSVAFLQAENRLNSVYWQGGKPNTWWFQELVVEENVYQGTWRSNWRFVYDPLTWLQPTSYRDRFGYIPADVDDIDYTKLRGNGWTRATLKGSYDFNGLGLKNVLG